MKTEERTISIRLSGETYAKVEEFRDKMIRDLPGSKPSIADAVRVLLERSLRTGGTR
jgi:hypothetical protein